VHWTAAPRAQQRRAVVHCTLTVASTETLESEFDLLFYYFEFFRISFDRLFVFYVCTFTMLCDIDMFY